MGNKRTLERQRNREVAKQNKKFWMNKRDIDISIEKAIEQQKKDQKYEINSLANAIASAFFMALHDDFGFGQKRLLRLHVKTLKIFNDVIDGHLTTHDIKQWLKENRIDYRLMQEKAIEQAK